MRLSIINLAGTTRTDVAVGTESDASMLWTTRAATPLMGSALEAPGVTRVGIGFTTGSAGVFGGVVTTGATVSCTLISVLIIGAAVGVATGATT